MPAWSASEVIASARRSWLRRRLGCTTIAEASDVVSAGAAGDSTHLLCALLAEARGLRTYCAVRDSQAIAVCGTARPETGSRERDCARRGVGPTPGNSPDPVATPLADQGTTSAVVTTNEPVIPRRTRR